SLPGGVDCSALQWWTCPVGHCHRANLRRLLLAKAAVRSRQRQPSGIWRPLCFRPFGHYSDQVHPGNLAASRISSDQMTFGVLIRQLRNMRQRSPGVAQSVLYEDFAVCRIDRVELLTVGADCRLVSVALVGG